MDAHPPAAAEFRERAVEIALRKAQSGENAFRGRLQPIAVKRVVAVFKVADFFEQRVMIGVRRVQFIVQLRQTLLNRQRFFLAFQHDLQNRAAAVRDLFLRQIADFVVSRFDDLAVVILDFAAQNAEHGRFARAVRPD